LIIDTGGSCLLRLRRCRRGVMVRGYCQRLLLMVLRLWLLLLLLLSCSQTKGIAVGHHRQLLVMVGVMYRRQRTIAKVMLLTVDNLMLLLLLLTPISCVVRVVRWAGRRQTKRGRWLMQTLMIGPRHRRHRCCRRILCSRRWWRRRESHPGNTRWETGRGRGVRRPSCGHGCSCVVNESWQMGRGHNRRRRWSHSCLWYGRGRCVRLAAMSPTRTYKTRLGSRLDYYVE